MRREDLSSAGRTDHGVPRGRGRSDENEQIAKYELDAIASDDLDQTLAEIDADFVIDLTIPEAHCMVCCKAMEAGFHVVSEKPMAASMDEARKMVATSEKTGKLYMVRVKEEDRKDSN